MWSFPFNIAQPQTDKPATLLHGDALLGSNTDSPQTAKKGHFGAQQVEALGVDLHFSEFKSCFLGQTQLQENFYIPTACWQVYFYPKQTNAMSNIPKDLHLKQLKHILKELCQRVIFFIRTNP